MKRIYKILTVTLMLTLLLAAAPPAYAFDGRGGENLVIPAGEIVNDDLYVGAQSLTLDGTVKGDLIVAARTVVINGTVEGDLIAGAETVIINGTVGDDARVGAAAIQLGEHANVGGDLVAAGASVEARSGSAVGRDLVAGSGQTLLAGEVGRNVIAGTGALQIDGKVAGDVKAYVNVTEQTDTTRPMNMYLGNSPIILPQLKPGLTVGKSAQIEGGLDYTSNIELAIPAGVVAGKVNRLPVSSQFTETRRVPTAAEKVADWIFDILRSIITIILFGLLLTWLFPRFMALLPANLKEQPLLSLGWGAVTFAAVFVAAGLIVLATVILALVGLRWNIFWLGWLLLSTVGITFLFATSYLAKVVVGETIGKWILRQIKPSLAEHRIWPMLTGVMAVVLMVELLRFPLAPFALLGWLLNFVVILLGLGALWIWGREAWKQRAPGAPALG